MLMRTLLVFALSAPLVPAGAVDAPQRVVSINLCSDQLILELAPAERIASLSHLVADPGVSLLAGQSIIGTEIPLNHGLAEEILPLAPDLVVAGRHSARPTIALLRRLNVPLLSFDIAHSLADVRQAVRELGAALGVNKRAGLLIDAFDARLQQLSVAGGDPRPRAIYLQPNGYTAGQGSLVDDVLRHAGLRNLGAELGLQGHGKVSLEQLLQAEPELLILDERDQGYPSLATEFLSHPAIIALAARIPKIIIPPRLWLCGLPGTLDALEQLTLARTALLEGRSQ